MVCDRVQPGNASFRRTQKPKAEVLSPRNAIALDTRIPGPVRITADAADAKLSLRAPPKNKGMYDASVSMNADAADAKGPFPSGRPRVLGRWQQIHDARDLTLNSLGRDPFRGQGLAEPALR
jgi:hypothetical protein